MAESMHERADTSDDAALAGQEGDASSPDEKELIVEDTGDDNVPSAKPLSKDDQALRDQQLSFFRKDVERLNTVLKSFLKASQSKCAYLITTGGHVITKVGATDSLDTDTVAALVSGAFAATRKLFEVFGEKNFAMTVQKGKHESLFLGLVGTKAIFTVLFDEKTNQGTVQLYSNKAIEKLDALFASIARGEGGTPDEDEKLVDDFGDSAGGALDDVFGS
jgi:predicted regulator of Ras-like GTPase activity (Roadblock/LC7/MglB family)